MAFNRKQRLRDNIEAIRTAFLLDREERTPTEAERGTLRSYCGFGGLKCILNPAKELTDAVHWAKSDLELFAPRRNCTALSVRTAVTRRSTSVMSIR